MKDLVIIGRQGSGKGTQGKILAERFGYKIFETGAELRNMASENSDLGHKIAEITGRGDLVSNDLVMEILENFLAKLEKNVPVIFDGVPRSLEQMQTFEGKLQKLRREFQALEMTVDNESAISRLIERGRIEKRSDDNIVAIQNRIENFEKYTMPILERWRSQGKLVEINGEQPIEKVHQDIVSAFHLVVS